MPLKVALVADLLEERWPSMDLLAEMLLAYLPSASPRVDPVLVRAPFKVRFGLLRRSTNGDAHVFDRILNRFADYPRWLRRNGGAADVYHVLDHSYAHLALELPPHRTVITCHDIDAFRSLVDSPGDRSLLPRPLVRRVLAGLRHVRLVAANTAATRDELIRHGLVSEDRVTVVPMAVHPSCSPDPDGEADAAAGRFLGPRGETIDILHVGSSIPRKRIDVVLDLTSALARSNPRVRLVRVGGPFTEEQRARVHALGIAQRIVVLPHIDRRVLAAVYRRAAVVILPSEREGFGLPVIEALACGTPVVASDIPALREVGGSAAVFCPVGDVAAWTRTVATLIEAATHERQARREAALCHARRYNWQSTAAEFARIYAAVAGRAESTSTTGAAS